jgi:hypothetical protein
MKDDRRKNDVVMAFYPNARGFAYVVFEGPRCPIDWRIAEIPRRYKVRRSTKRLACLLDQYRPDVLVMRKMPQDALGDNGLDFGPLAAVSRRTGIRVVQVSRTQVKEAFAGIGMPTRYAIATAIVHHIPIFAPLLPPPRKIWNGEDRRMGLFDAASLALTFFGDFSGWEAGA